MHSKSVIKSQHDTKGYTTFNLKDKTISSYNELLMCAEEYKNEIR